MLTHFTELTLKESHRLGGVKTMDAFKRDQAEAAADQERIREELRVRLFEPAPEGFDPTDSNTEELLAHGYPARPDSQLHPEQYHHWKQTMSRPMAIIRPQFAVMPDGVRPAAAERILSSSNWSGTVAVARDGDAVFTVFSEWTVPHVAPPHGQGSSECATWVGIDGGRAVLSSIEGTRVAARAVLGDPEGPPPVGSFPPNEVSTDILQAGTTQQVIVMSLETPWGTRTFTFENTWAWWEWVPGPPVGITNLPVSPGDVMFCEIRALSATEARIFLLNETSGLATSFVHSAPDGTQLVGDCAEWILEKRNIDVAGFPLELANYGRVYFDNCSAFTRRLQTLDLGTAESLLFMIDNDGNDISVPTVVTNELMRVNRVGMID